MKIKFRSINIAEILFLLSWIILMAGKGMGYSATDIIYRNISWAAIAFALMKVLITQYDRHELIACILLNLLGILVWIFSGGTTVLMTMVIITSMKGVDYKYVFKISLWIRGFMFVVRTSLAIMGILDDQHMSFYLNGGIRIRYALGFGHPNATHFNLFVVVVLCVLVYHYKLKTYHYLALFLYNIYIFRYTDSRAGFLMTALFIGVSFLASRKYIGKFMWDVVARVANKAFIVTSAASIIVSVLFWKVDILRSWGTFSSRFGTAIYVMENNLVNLFGTRGISTDLGMVYFMYADGILFFMLFMLGYYILLKKYTKQSDIYFLLACCCYAVYCLSEAYADSILMNVTLLAFGQLLYCSQRDEEIGRQKRLP